MAGKAAIDGGASDMTSRQQPIHSGFSRSSTAAEIVRDIDLRGQAIVVTGGYSGLGLETVRALTGVGATVVVPARDVAMARLSLASLPLVQCEALDLMQPESIDSFADRFASQHPKLDVLINCAGIMANPLTRDARGNESQLSTNHLGHFQLAVRLWPTLAAAGNARIVALSSRGHRFSAFNFGDPNFNSRPYDRWQAYGQSKTANALFAVEADARGKSRGIRAFAVHPGTILTGLARHLTDEDLASFGVSRETPRGFVPEGQSAAEGGTFKTIEQGAATVVWCATSPLLENHGGVYCEDADIAVVSDTDDANAAGVKPWAVDPVAARELWEWSERMTGVQLEADRRVALP